jgi:hypothetical protein
MLGVFGLGLKPTNFSDFNSPQPSFLWSLKNQSLSYAYAAGASYNSSLASLVLGGYDEAIHDLGKRGKQDVQFDMDLSFNVGVGLQAIEGSDMLVGEASLLPKGVQMWIDSTVPEIWLPGAACDLFASVFGE